MKGAARLDTLPAYLFAEIDRQLQAARDAGVDVIDLGIGDPDRPTPEGVVAALAREAARPAYHRYPPYQGLPEFRRAAARWMARRFGVQLDPDTQVLGLIGSKEGLAHLAWAVIDPGSVGLVPDPAYPVYATAVLLAGGQPYRLPLRAEHGFLPDLAAIPEEVADRARLLYLNYPNNPTGATASLGFFEQAVAWAQRHDVLLCHDAAYSEITYDGYVAPSILQVPGAMEVAIEFFSLSKPYNMTGWRIGWACGNRQAVELLGRLKTHLDSGLFGAIQQAAIHALEQEEAAVAAMRSRYQARRDRVIRALHQMGWPVEAPKGSLYLWIHVPAGWQATTFAGELLRQTGVVVTPGIGYGQQGEGYVRISLTVPDDRLDEALRRWTASSLHFHRPRA